MKLPRTAGVIGALVAVVCALAGWAQPAEADDPQPTQGVFYEIFEAFSPFAPACADVPGGTHRSGTQINVYHCHSGGNQLWQFWPLGDGSYRIINHDTNQC